MYFIYLHIQVDIMFKYTFLKINTYNLTILNRNTFNFDWGEICKICVTNLNAFKCVITRIKWKKNS